jgi:imidazolonepropionase-like amidohydrolase
LSTTSSPTALAIVGGHVWDATRGVPIPETVLIEGGRIAAVGPDLPIPEGSERIDADGKTATGAARSDRDVRDRALD